MKKRFTILAILFISVTTQAADIKIPTPGTYQFQGQLSIIQKKRYEVAYTGSLEGLERIKELRKLGAICEAKPRQFYLCSQFVNPSQNEKEISRRVQTILKKKSFTFSQTTGDPVLISKGDSLTFWRIPQTVRTNEKTYESYEYMQGQGVDKIFLGPSAEETLNIHSSTDELIYPLSIQKTESRWVYYSYLILARYSH